MFLFEDVEKIRIFGQEVYRFGFFAMLGVLAAAAVMTVLCVIRKCGKGTAPLLLTLSLVLGGVCSRLGFCLMNRELPSFMPLGSWFSIGDGGWSMTMLCLGVLLAACVTARITDQKPGRILDIAACSLPAFMILERLGEEYVEDFDYSRALKTEWLRKSFLAVSDDYDTYLATWRLAAIVMGVILIVLLVDLFRSKKDGNTFVLFLLLYGSATVLLESLRSDRFLSISFVGMQHILGALFLWAGAFLIGKKHLKKHPVLSWAAILSPLLSAGIALWMEFELEPGAYNLLKPDTLSRPAIYGIYIAALAVPVVLALLLRGRKDAEAAK